jgi:iron complex outermembrane receptor protein
MSGKKRLHRKAVCLALSVSLAPSAAWAKTADSASAVQADAQPAADEIIVTAQKRDQSLIDVPITISALSGETLKQRAFANITDLADLVPGVRMTTPGGTGNTAITIRGVGQRDVGLHQEAPVSTYVDGAYVSLSTVIAQPIYDVDRVEVLKGPQGTLFGRNATGGLIQFISHKPSEVFGGYNLVEYGSFNKFKLEGAIGGGLAQGLSARFSYHAENGGAYMKNLAGEDHNGNTNYSGRLQLLYAPSSDFSALLNIYGAIWHDQPGPALADTRLMLDANGTPIVPPSFSAYQAFCSNVVGVTPNQAGPSGNCFGTQSSPQSVRVGPGARYAAKYWSGTLTIAAGLGGGVNLTSITNYQAVRDYRADIPADTATGNPTLLVTNIQPKADQLSEELRLDGNLGQLHWVTGIYALQIQNHSGNSLNLQSLPKFGVLLNSTNYTNTKSLAAFAEVNYNITPQLSFILGGRLTHDSKHGINNSGCVSNPLIPFDVCALIQAPVVAFTGYDLSFKKTSWSGRAVIQYKPTNDVMLFAGVNRGTKAGGFNSGGVEFYPVSAAQFAPEVLTNYEVGIKSRLFGRMLTLNASAFYYDYKDYQTFSAKNAALQVFNVDATIKGFEFDAALRPTRGLELRASATYLDTEQKSVPFGTGIANFPLPQAPKWSVNASARYGIHIGEGELFGLLSFTHVDNTSIAAVPFVAENLQGYDRYDARIGYDTDKFSIAFNVRNLRNKTIYTGRVPLEAIIGASNDGVDLPRTYTASLTFHY